MIYFSFSETPVQIPLQRHNEWFVLEPAGRTVEGVWALISDGLSLFCILPLGASVTFQVSVSLIHKYNEGCKFQKFNRFLHLGTQAEDPGSKRKKSGRKMEQLTGFWCSLLCQC